MSIIHVERVGGLAGFGGANLESRGDKAYADLSADDQRAVDALFAARGSKADDGPVRDGFRYKLSRKTAKGIESVEVPERVVPAALAAVVRDTLR